MFKKKAPSVSVQMRETLFGDMPLADWGAHPGEPWAAFAEAKRYLDTQQTAKGIETLHAITTRVGLESRHYLQAWHFLRQLGVNPPDAQVKELYGVVVEVALDKGLDIVAAYADLSARYYNFSGKGSIIWEHPDRSLDAEIEALLNEGRTVVNQIGPWEQARPPAPTRGQVRLNMLTPSGLHFGQGPFETLAADPRGGPLITAATQLMQALIAKVQK
jgi:hypothetical protein